MQGWKNYQSWITNLWLENDPALYNRAVKMRCRDKFKYAERLKELILDLLDYELIGLKEDLLDSAIQEIDWVEIAESWMSEDNEDDEDDEDDE